MSTSFVKLPNCGGKTYFLLTHLKDQGSQGCQLTLTDGEQFWEGEITEEDLDAQSSNLKMDFTTYVKKTVAALTCRDKDIMTFTYQLKPQAQGVADFLWKEQVGDIKILLGSATLHQQKGAGGGARGVDGAGVRGMLSGVLGMVQDLQSSMESLQADNTRLAQDRTNALKRLEKCIAAKEELEQDLYSKFAAVLNSKKEKIQNLLAGRGDSMESIAEDPAPSTSGETNAGSKRARGKAGAVNSAPSQDSSAAAGDTTGSMSEEGEGRDTDEETPPTKRRAPVRKGREAMADNDCSLNLGDDDDDDNNHVPTQRGKQVVRRPARQRGGTKRQTPSKPVLPKVTSKSSDPGAKTPQRGSLRKSGSGERSMDNLDTDDLLKDF